MLRIASHNWLNKQMGITVPERVEWTEGKVNQRIIQQHISGKRIHQNLKNIPYKFPIVEEIEFDARTKFFIEINSKYGLIGYADGLNYEEKMLAEIKLYNGGFSMNKFINSMQRKIYAWGFPMMKRAVLITGKRNPELWEDYPLKTSVVPMTKQDIKEAKQWVNEGIAIIERGDFTGGLTNGKCLDPWCHYGVNCFFK
ncbi:hypothetical protein A2575_01240 [Candidatus Roizmanbacteria bacterium RIFOXYD1_FULL_41_24]|nr:MAG: hypothetical protein A2575_01240 [Candidatus Roizmanbacteria bacterium RIFOXYD1_FULL_41_24]